MYKIIGADREEYGPVSADELHSWIIQGRADARTMAQAVGGAEWKPLADFPEFAAALAGAGAARPATPPLVGSPALRPDVPTYLVWSILVTVICACVFGLPAIFYSAQVTSKLNRGDFEGARQASRNARLWCWIGFILGALLNIGSLLLVQQWARKILPTLQ